jgi:hypothetical protein
VQAGIEHEVRLCAELHHGEVSPTGISGRSRSTCGASGAARQGTIRLQELEIPPRSSG